MTSSNLFRRRDFITSGAAGLLALTAAPSGFHAVGQTAAAGAASAPEALDKLLRELESRGRQMLSVPRQDGQFLNLLVSASRSRNVLEIGTSHGYSAIWISLALEETGGRLTTIDIDPEKVRLAKENVGKASLSHRVTFHEGDAHQLVTTLDGPFDFVFLDADKEGQMDYFKKLYPDKLAPGGIIAVHNAIHSRRSMREYLDTVSQHRDFTSVVLSVTMDDGFSISYRKRRGER